MIYMVKVELNLLNIFELKLKKKSIEYEGSTIEDIISKFLEQHKDSLEPELLNKNGKKLNKQMVILLNGRNIDFLKGYKTEVKEGDKLYISVPLAGG